MARSIVATPAREEVERPVLGAPTRGTLVKVRVRLTSDLGRVFERSRSVFVAPHDPARERRRVDAPDRAR